MFARGLATWAVAAGHKVTIVGPGHGQAEALVKNIGAALALGPNDHARSLLLAAVGREPSDAPPLRVDGTADRAAAPASRLGQPPTSSGTSATKGRGEVSETSVKRGIVSNPSSLRGGKTGPLCGPRRHGAMLTRLTVAFSAGPMCAAGRRRGPKWKFRIMAITIISSGRRRRSSEAIEQSVSAGIGEVPERHPGSEEKKPC